MLKPTVGIELYTGSVSQRHAIPDDELTRFDTVS